MVKKNINEASFVDPANDTAAVETLRPNGGSASKAEAMQRLMNVAGSLPIEDISQMLDAMLAQVGQEGAAIPNDASAKNFASISAKPSAALGMKEDVEAMFAGETLSEEFKAKATIIFEAVVGARLTIETQRVEEEYDVKLRDEVDSSVEELTEKIDEYLNYVVFEWVKDNEVAIENSLRAEISENFINGLKNLFLEHNIEVPEEKADLLSQLADRVEDLEATLNDKIKENMDLIRLNTLAVKKDAFEAVAEGLVKTQAEKLKTLVESVEFDNLEGYTEKLKVIKDSYFKTNTSSKAPNLLTEEQEAPQEAEKEQTYTDPNMKAYVEAFKRTNIK